MANAGFQNYRPRRTFWYIETNVVLRRPPTPISKLLFEPYLLHYIGHIKSQHSDHLMFFNNDRDIHPRDTNDRYL